MSEKKIETRAFKLIYECPACGFEMEPTGKMFIGYPPSYEHRCTNKICKHTAVLSKTYPKIELQTL